MAERLAITSGQQNDAEKIVAIYNQALDGRLATFETKHRTTGDIASWFDEEVPVMLAVLDGKIAGFAKVSSYRDRACYAGIREYSIYVTDNYQRLGIGRLLLQALIKECRKAGVWKLMSRIFPENVASIELAKSVGFRVVGTYLRHGRLEGDWKDCVIVELSL